MFRLSLVCEFKYTRVALLHIFKVRYGEKRFGGYINIIFNSMDFHNGHHLNIILDHCFTLQLTLLRLNEISN